MLAAKPAASPPAKRPALPLEIYQQAVDQADLAISITDLDANILYANEAFSRITGYPPEEVVGKNESMLSNQTTPRSLYSAMWSHLTGGRPWSGRLLNRRKNGELYLADINITPVEGADGQVTHYLGMHRDITVLHQLECQVRNQKHLIESTVDAAPIVFVLLDIEGRVLLDNHEYKKLVTDLDIAEPAHAILDMLNPGWRQQLAQHAGASTFANRHARIDRPGGSTRWFSCSATLIKLHDENANAFFCGGYSTGLLLAFSDVTALHAEQERARIAALQAMLADEERIASIRESLSAALFRLEEPMNVMSSAVNLLRRRDPTGAELLHSAVEASREHIEALRQAVPQGEPAVRVSVNLNEVLHDVLRITTPALLAAGIVVDWQPAPTLPALLGQPLQLRMLFKALIENAVEAVDVKGWRHRSLAISTRIVGDCIVTEIADSGPGLPPELCLRAFEPFFTTKNGAGRHLGTGLSRAQQVAAEQDGFIELACNQHGGCTARVEFRLGGEAG